MKELPQRIEEAKRQCAEHDRKQAEAEAQAIASGNTWEAKEAKIRAKQREQWAREQKQKEEREAKQRAREAEWPALPSGQPSAEEHEEDDNCSCTTPEMCSGLCDTSQSWAAKLKVAEEAGVPLPTVQEFWRQREQERKALKGWAAVAGKVKKE